EGRDYSTPDDKEFMKLQDWLNHIESQECETEYRTDSEEDYRFYASKQDSPEILAKLAGQNRPATVFNEIKPKVDMLIGMAQQSPFVPQLIPVGREDEPLVELMQGTIGHYRRKLKIQEKELSCFEHTVKTGRSLLYFWIDRSNPFKPEIKAKRIPGYSFWVDQDSIEYDLSDARYVFIDKWLTEEEIESYWPNYPIEDVKHLSQTSGGSMPIFYNVALERYRIVECWYKKWVRVYWFVNPLTGEPENLEPDEYREFVKALAEGVPNPENPEEMIFPEVEGYVESRMQKIYYRIFSGLSTFEYGESPYKMNIFPFVLYGAYKDDEINKWFGAIAVMKDPQKSLNTMRRQLSHLLQTLPKGLLAHEAGSILNIEEYEQRSADPTFHMELAKGAINKYKFEQQPQISPIYREFDEVSRQSMKDTSGITTEMMGVQTTSREPGISVRLRLEAAAVVLYLLFDNFRKSRIQGTKILMSLIQQYVTEPELIRIQGTKGQQLLEINTQVNPQIQGFNDISFAEFDVEFEEIAETGSMRAATAMLLAELNHQNPGAIPPHIILEYTNIPFTVKQEIKEFWQAAQEAEMEERQKDREVELAKVAGGIYGRKIAADASKQKRNEGGK
ncbi:MAG: hypothetical protein WCY49_07040, partial [Anaerovoracaceae bacterium]